MPSAPNPTDNSPAADLRAIARSLAVIQRDLNLIVRVVLPLCTRQLSRAEQARRAGVCQATITRREQRAGARLRGQAITLPAPAALAELRERYGQSSE